MSAAKWILGGLGFVLGGPIGALIGVLIGSAFSSDRALPGDRDSSTGSEGATGTAQQTSASRSRQKVSPADVRISLLVLIACVMKADGHVKKAELDVVKRFLVRNYGDQGALDALHILKGLLEQDIDQDAVAEQIARHLNYSTRLELLHFLLELAFSDGYYAEQEEQVIINICRHLNLTTADYRALLALYQKNVNPDWAYTALEITPSATDEEVKKAYRRMAMKYHPDKVTTAGEEIKAKATEKFQNINKAYEFIKQQRNL